MFYYVTPLDLTEISFFYEIKLILIYLYTSGVIFHPPSFDEEEYIRYRTKGNDVYNRILDQSLLWHNNYPNIGDDTVL